MKNKQTAVEWLEDNLIGNPHSEEDFKHNIMIWGQAKQIEKEREQTKKEHIKDAYFSGWLNGDVKEDLVSDLSEEYYNETYKQQDNNE
jgi:hypothetical protein